MRRAVAGLAAASLTLAAAVVPAAAQGDAADLSYRHPPAGSGLLEGSDGRAYWLLLAECAGFYGAIANARDSEGDEAGFEDFRRRGVDSYHLALARLQADRGLAAGDAAALAAPRVESAREMAQAHLARDPAIGPGTTPAAILRSTCLDLEQAYAAVAG